MKCFIYYGLLLSILSNVCYCKFPNIYGKIKEEKINGNPGKPLILTSYLEENKIEEALKLSEVKLKDFQNVKSYSGYFTVNEDFDSNMFFWFFPSETDYKNDPVVLWLQGGPGATSLIALFTENGPFLVNENLEVELRKTSWTKSHSVIFIDNPVGTGYSFTNNGYAMNETRVGEDLYNCLQQFFTLFPDLRKNPFFVTGESYAGKYIPAIGHTIHQKNPEAKQKINLQGVAMGNAFSDPENQIEYGEYLYQLGLYDSNTKELVQKLEKQGVEYIKKNDFKKAFDLFDTLMDGDFHNSIFKANTGFENYYNYLYEKDPINIEYMGKFVQKDYVRSAIHVGDTKFSGEGTTVELNLYDDIYQSVAPWVTELLNNYKVLIYNGQLDIICAYPLTVNYLQKLDFNGKDEYKTAKRYQWHVDDFLAGYVRTAGNLTEVLVRNSGHLVPADQPVWAYDMLYKFTRNQSLKK